VNDNLRDQDIRHLWHPYTDITTFENEPYTCIERGEGVYLYDTTGRPIFDGISSWWAVALGHSHPYLVEAIREQAGILQNSILGNMSHPRAVEVAQRLTAIAPEGLNHAYFAGDGASATEAALKMAVQYWQNVGVGGKNRFISIEEGYHGDTLGAIGAGFTSWFQEPFGDLVIPSFRATSPHCTCCAYDTPPEEHCAITKHFPTMEAQFEAHHHETAAVILEPLCQGSAGIRIYPAEYLRKLRALCDRYQVLFIADEIAVGFGRTGSMWACDEAGITPDILCAGKALTGGYLPMSATLATETIYDSFRSDGIHKRAFWDGHTYCGNPIAAAVAIAAMDVFEREQLPQTSTPIMASLKKGFEGIGQLSSVSYQKTLGLIGMCEFVDYEDDGIAFVRKVAINAMSLGLFIRPLGTVLYLWPPLVTTESELLDMLDIFKQAILKTMEESG
jgi:adenosylmethionine-8-amino-7-oxononanoate aminotransferase